MSSLQQFFDKYLLLISYTKFVGSTHIIFNGGEVTVKHTLVFTMVDGKVNKL